MSTPTVKPLAPTTAGLQTFAQQATADLAAAFSRLDALESGQKATSNGEAVDVTALTARLEAAEKRAAAADSRFAKFCADIGHDIAADAAAPVAQAVSATPAK